MIDTKIDANNTKAALTKLARLNKNDTKNE